VGVEDDAARELAFHDVDQADGDAAADGETIAGRVGELQGHPGILEPDETAVAQRRAAGPRT
jgi:hypothetical protein